SGTAKKNRRWTNWRTRSVSVRATFIACSRPPRALRPRTTPRLTVLRKFGKGWPLAARSRRRSMMRASIRAGAFYEKSADMLGMTPSQYRAGGANEKIKFAVGQSYLGAILVASTKKGVAAILLGDDPDKLVRDLQDRFPKAHLIGADRDYENLVARVVGFVE